MPPAGSFATAIGVGIGIELTNPISAKLLADRIATLSELREHGHKTIEQCLLLAVVVCGQRFAHQREHVLNRSALQRRASCAFKRPASIPTRRCAVTLGNVQRDGLQCAPKMRTGVDPSRYAVLSHARSSARPTTDRLDGRTLDVELLMTEWHRAFSLSIPIPIPIATPTPIALRRWLDSVVSVIHEPLLSRPAHNYLH